MSLLSLDVTRRKLTLGSPDSVTGWYSKSYTESTIEMMIIPRAASDIASAAGVYVRLDAVGLTCDGVDIGDEIKTASNVYYEVKATKEHWVADSFMYRECDLVQLPLHELV